MGYVITLQAPREVTLVEYSEPDLAPNQVRLRTLYSGISAGTELNSYRGVSPYLTKRWDSARHLFVSGEPSTAYPLNNWGYEEVGEIAEVGAAVSRVKQGDIIWGTWGHRSTHTASEDWAADRILPATLDPLCGIFSHVGSIGLNVMLDADIHLGEFVAVFGQGVMGLTVTQMVMASGGTVIAVDGIARRLELARACGATHLINFNEQSPAEGIKALTGNRGADVSIEITGTYSALNEAIRATAYNSRVVAASSYPGPGTALQLGDEFHHNRVQVICSQISGSNPSLDHRWDRLRLNQTVMRLQAQGVLDLKRLISDIIPAQDAARAYQQLDKDPSAVVEVVLKF
jgi:threonine dehydrogenase-like Zn-dependent dehydrogenase